MSFGEGLSHAPPESLRLEEGGMQAGPQTTNPWSRSLCTFVSLSSLRRESQNPLFRSMLGSCAFIGSLPVQGTCWEEGKPNWGKELWGPSWDSPALGGTGQPRSPGPWTRLSLPVSPRVCKSTFHHQGAHRSGLQCAPWGAWPGSWAQSRQTGTLPEFWGRKAPRGEPLAEQLMGQNHLFHTGVNSEPGRLSFPRTTCPRSQGEPHDGQLGL